MKKILSAIGKFFKQFGHSFIKHKIISVFMVIVLGVGSFFGYRYLKLRNTANQTAATYVRTVTLTKTTLNDTVSLTGTVVSANVSTVTSSLNAKIKTINVSVGDYVSAGDVIITLDSTDIEKQIAEVEENITDAKEAAQDAYDDALEAKNDAWTACFGTGGTSEKLQTAKTNLATATTALNQAKSDLASYISAEDTASSALTAAGQNLSSSTEEVLSVSVGSNITFYATATGTTIATADKNNYTLLSTDAGIGTYQLAYVNAYLAEAKANANLSAAKTSYGYATIENNYNSASTAYTQASNNYTAAYQTYKSAETKLATALEELEEGSTNQLESLYSELSDLQESLDECSLTAQSSGKVTALNATIGNTPNGTLATIQDTDDLAISIAIEEADVQSVAVGMDCIITSDGTTGDIAGELTQVSPVASTTGMGSTASTFSAEVQVLNGNNGLLIGMNATVDIIISTVADVYSVPYDAVETDDDGNSYVYEQVSGSGTDAVFEKVQVTIGTQTNYYIEISGENVYEGMVIRASAVESEAVTEVQASSFSLSDLFGGGSSTETQPSSGTMPSGGGTAPSGSGGTEGRPE